MTTNLSNEKLQEKLEKAIEEFNQIDAQLRQARENVDTLEKGLEQARGRVITLDGLLREQTGTNGEVPPDVQVSTDGPPPEVVQGEVVN